MILVFTMMVSMLPAGSLRANAATGDVQIDATNFPDETFRSYVSKEFDADGNGVLSTTEITEVTEIDVFGKAKKKSFIF